MFEYLMPLLFTQTHENSLLDRAWYDAVRCQIGYARQNRVPWGISESPFSALDRITFINTEPWRTGAGC